MSVNSDLGSHSASAKWLNGGGLGSGSQRSPPLKSLKLFYYVGFESRFTRTGLVANFELITAIDPGSFKPQPSYKLVRFQESPSMSRIRSQ